MKITFKIMACAMMVSLALTSCSKKEETPQPNTSNNNSTSGLSFKHDGTTITCDSTEAVLYTLGVSPFNRMIDVYGYKNGSTVMEMHFQPKTGTMPADKTFTNAWLTYADAIDYYDCKTGSLTLTTCDTTSNKISGTFNFVGENMGGTSTKTITEGTINISSITKR